MIYLPATPVFAFRAWGLSGLGFSGFWVDCLVIVHFMPGKLVHNVDIDYKNSSTLLSYCHDCYPESRNF